LDDLIRSIPSSQEHFSARSHQRAQKCNKVVGDTSLGVWKAEIRVRANCICCPTPNIEVNICLLDHAEDNTYKIILYLEFSGFYEVFLPPPNEHGDRLITLRRCDDCDLPDPVLLKTHAAIVKILHVSGKADEIDAILRNRKEIRFLACDGNTDVGKILPVLLS
jgi:hypothetical protein